MCSSEPQLIGSWEELIPGSENHWQGFNLEQNGVASSINMSTLLYESWQRENDLLILSGKSVGNGQTLDFTDTMTIKKLTSDSLVVQRMNVTLRYRKQ